MRVLLRKAKLLTFSLSYSLVFSISLMGCFGDDEASSESSTSCAPFGLTRTAGSTGPAFVFNPDPASFSGNSSVSPTSFALNDFRESVELQRLGGLGVLEGTYVDVRNGIDCGEGFGAYHPNNQFNYLHNQRGFQEAMAYHFGDQYRAFLDSNALLEPVGALKVVAHCLNADNAFYLRFIDGSGQKIEKICLGDSLATPGAFYSDDATVVIHELQHAATMNHYHLTKDLNRFWSDEAGALNEALSDFMALIFVAPNVTAPMDPRVFSRWALGSFFPNFSAERGANLCPSYDSNYPDCGGYAFGASGFSSQPGQSHVSYSYPDGVGWPYPHNFSNSGPLRDIYLNYRNQEEIHNTGVVLVGALWDVYETILNNHNGDANQARNLVTDALFNAVRNLPQPDNQSLSPVTFMKLAQLMIDVAPSLGWNAQDIASMETALEQRGLYKAPQLEQGWASVGPGTSSNPGLKIEDHPIVLKSWLLASGKPSNVVTHSVQTGQNGKLDPGETALIWFDIQNESPLTAGGLQVTVTSNSPHIEFLNSNFNDGSISNQTAQVRYYKVNGTDIVDALSSSNQSFHVPTGNSYFKTNPHFSNLWTTGLWVHAKSSAPSGLQTSFSIEIEPVNGSTEIVQFDITLN